MRTPEQQIKYLEERIRLLETIVLEGKPAPCPEWDRVVEAGMRKDFGPWFEFERRGGVIPEQFNGDIRSAPAARVS